MTAVNGGPLWSAGKCAVQSIMSFGKRIGAKRPCGAACSDDSQCRASPSSDGHERQNVIKYDRHGTVEGFLTEEKDSPAICVPSTMDQIKDGAQSLRTRFTGAAPVKGTLNGFCRRCVSGGILLPGKTQVKYLESVSKTDEWKKFEDEANEYGKCKRNSDCMSDMCFGNNFGTMQGNCAPYNLPIGASCYYKQSCGTAMNEPRKCIGNGFGRKGVCWWEDEEKINNCATQTDGDKKGGCECTGDKQCHSKLCIGNWWSVGVCQTALKPKAGATVVNLDQGDDTNPESCTVRKTAEKCISDQSTPGTKVKCTWCADNTHFDKCRKKPWSATCSGGIKCPSWKNLKYDKKTKTCIQK